MRRPVGSVFRAGLNPASRRGSRLRRNSVAGQSILFAPLIEQDPAAIYRAARTAIPTDNSGGFVGSGVFITLERDHLALVKVRNAAMGEMAEIVVCVENVDGIQVARLTATGRMQRRGRAVVERLQDEWVAGMRRWDRAGAVSWRGNHTLPAVGSTPTPMKAPPAGESTTQRRRRADTMRRTRRANCHACGHTLPIGVSFCPGCGQDLIAPEAPARP
jgi:hypothetical protein